MKTKNFLSIAALMICGLVCVNNVKAEGTPTKTDNAIVNIKFQPVQSIVVNPASKIVDIVYKTKDNYADGVSIQKDDHLEVFSTGGFQVNVSIDKDFTRTAGGTIDADDVTVKANLGASTTIGIFYEVALSTTPTLFIAGTSGGTALKYNVTYDNTAGAGNVYIDKYVHPDTPESVYTGTVTYTILTN